MIGYKYPLGSVEICQDYFAALIGNSVSECFGVAGMISSPYQGLVSVVKKTDIPDKGVKVKISDGALIVDIHIAVTYGINISAIVQSIVHKVGYIVEYSTGFKVSKVNVHVDSLVSQ